MSGSRAIVLGYYKGTNESSPLKLTAKAEKFDTTVGGKLSQALKSIPLESESVLPFSFISPDFSWVVMTGLGDLNAKYCPVEEIELQMEQVRKSVAKAIRVCESFKVESVTLDDCNEPKCVGEVVSLSQRVVSQWKQKCKENKTKFELYLPEGESSMKFEEGLLLGQAQVFASDLAETPPNLKTPTMISQYLKSKMPESVVCNIRDKQWIKEKKMELFLSVNQGSAEPPVLFEAHYKGANTEPIVLVGKGILFDSGGISIKPSLNMSSMKADMQGAAVVFATIRAIALLKLPIYVIAIAPFTDNMPSGSATRPGDVFVSMNGKTVEVSNTDAEGRLVLADCLTYAETMSPCQIIDLATLTGAIGVALGSATSAIFSENLEMIANFKKAASVSGDRVWRMPLYKQYSDMVVSKVADLINSTVKREAGSCTAAAFLKEFVKTDNWVHLDIASTMENDKTVSYIASGMSGRPTRTLIEYLKIVSKK